MRIQEIPKPHLDVQSHGSIRVLSDEALFQATGIAIAFSQRHGGVSSGPYQSLNLGSHVDDDIDLVRENRARLLEALGGGDLPLIVPKQVHGTDLVIVNQAGDQALLTASEQAARGADGVVVTVPQVAAMLCFADCVPIIIVSPSRRFAVVHAGWRGVAASIVVKALEALVSLDSADQTEPIDATSTYGPAIQEQEALEPSVLASTYNVYIGPYIHAECFECSEEVHRQFTDKFGDDCAFDSSHIDLGAALRKDLFLCGVLPERIADADICTVCSTDDYYSFRAADGLCGRHGALAFRLDA